MAYILEPKDIKSDSTKRTILSIQENFKIFIPLLAVLVIGLAVLNIFNATKNFMSVYVCVLVNIIALVAAAILLYKLLSGNIKQKKCFDYLKEYIVETSQGTKMGEFRYQSDTQSVLTLAHKVDIFEGEDSFLVLPSLEKYRHSLFTKYCFRDDFGKLILPKSDFTVSCREDEIVFQSADAEFIFSKIQ